MECAIADVPSPASFEKIPRAAPVMAAVIIDPTTPPVTAFGENAPTNIILIACGKKSKLRAITPKQSNV